MLIRKAVAADKENIVGLLKISLGEGLLKKSAPIWEYKHEDNPFGTSYVLVAEEDQQLIGVRALMAWNWQKGLQQWKAYRAVDTATHPAHQGKGIFKQLTLQALNAVGEASPCFIFNTPNSQSKPGYLKMGWKAVGKIRLTLWFVPLLGLWYRNKSGNTLENRIGDADLKRLCENHNQKLSDDNCFFTPKTTAYLKWRYENNPMQSYIVYSDIGFFVAVYVKKHKHFKELRIAEYIGALGGEERNILERELLALARKEECLLISAAGSQLFFGAIKGNFGPELLCREIEGHVVPELFNGIKGTWTYSLGDLELF